MVEGRQHVLLSAALLALTLCGYLLMAVKFPMAYLIGTYEDLFGEWLQFLLFASALVFSLRVALSPSRYRFFFALLALACFYVTMEEISWGQRVFGWSTPSFLRESNLQGETNIHNIFVGPVRSSAKSFAEYFLAVALTAYGALYPLFLNWGLAVARWLDRKGLAAPPLYLFPFFVAAAVLELGLFRFNEAEVAEIVIGLALTTMAIHYAFAPESPHGPPPAKEASHRIARVLGGTVAVSITLAALSTVSFVTSEGRRRQVEARLENGIEKFARRYARYERWDAAAALYERLLKIEPRRPSNLRRLAQVHRRAGNMDGFDENLARALEIDLERYRKNPGSPAVNRSLTRTYRLKGEKEKAGAHLREAVTRSLEGVRENPTSAKAAYSLARSYALEGSHDRALEQYRRAFELRRTSKKYRKAYLDAKAKMKKRAPPDPP